MVVDSDVERPLGGVLADDVALQELPDLGGPGQLVEFYVVGVGEFLFDDLVTQVDALVADVHAWPSNELFDLFLTLSAERALQQVTAVSDARHGAGGLLPVHGFDRAMSRVFPTLPACSAAMRPIEANRVGDIRVVRLNISLEVAPGSPERATVSLACRGRYATERQAYPAALH